MTKEEMIGYLRDSPIFAALELNTKSRIEH